MPKTQIDLTTAIARRKQEIKQLTKLRLKIQRLIDDSIAAEENSPCMPRPAWEALKKEVESELLSLGIAYIAHGLLPQMKELVGIPTYWSQAEIV